MPALAARSLIPAVLAAKRAGIRFALHEYRHDPVSAGRRGLEIALAPADLLRLCDAVVAAIAR